MIFVVASPQMELPMSKKKAKIICGLGITQLTIGILEVLFNIGASVMTAYIADYIGPGYWCGPFVSHVFLGTSCEVNHQSKIMNMNAPFQICTKRTFLQYSERICQVLGLIMAKMGYNNNSKDHFATVTNT